MMNTRYTLYTHIGHTFYRFDEDQLDQAEKLYNEFPGDMAFYDNEEMIRQKNPIVDFEGIIRASIFVIHKIQAELDEETISYYQAALEFLREGDAGLRLTGHRNVGKSTLMQVLCMGAVHKYITRILPMRMISLRQLYLAFVEEQHKCFETMELNGVTDQAICLDNITLNYLHFTHYYQQTFNVLGEFIEMRYELFVQRRILTHFVTHLSDEELLQHVGEDRYAMLCRMTNMLTMEGKEKNIVY